MCPVQRLYSSQVTQFIQNVPRWGEVKIILLYLLYFNDLYTR